jgi:hypothetical protein
LQPETPNPASNRAMTAAILVTSFMVDLRGLVWRRETVVGGVALVRLHPGPLEQLPGSRRRTGARPRRSVRRDHRHRRRRPPPQGHREHSGQRRPRSGDDPSHPMTRAPDPPRTPNTAGIIPLPPPAPISISAAAKPPLLNRCR